ncbi:hypothetical protein PRZ61_17800 [Halomonas pacifica]|uniref:VOC domain-containing protein n=1 Tax=Bisbaumannia pacifica TaxID=77098 RepID=A0A510X9G7_9GAMM|nr:hypothetical protein [Halomonas pacifica]MDC8805305.1 hypothetical protein [Halomonas pacifica]GEK48079.1 hypothetical protein HPA02_23620 [Halomonas pacifica]
MQRLSLEDAVLRLRELGPMEQFCTKVLRLPLILRTARSAIFALGSDERGHTQVLMLLEDTPEASPRELTLEVSEDEFPAACGQLTRHGARLFESEGSYAPGCAWRILHCSLPEGHRLRVISIDPRRCAPGMGDPGAAGR